MNIIGIDPGATGGIALLPESGLAEVLRMPDHPWGVHVALLSLRADEPGVVVWCEKAVLMPKNGAKANFAVGRNAGMIQGICAALRLPLHEVAPNTWRPKMVGRGTDKEAARKLAISHYPHLAEKLKFKNTHGLAEALLIAEWGRAYGSQVH